MGVEVPLSVSHVAALEDLGPLGLAWRSPEGKTRQGSRAVLIAVWEVPAPLVAPDLDHSPQREDPEGLAMKKRPASMSGEPAVPGQPARWTGRKLSLTAVNMHVSPSLQPARRPASPVLEVGTTLD